MVSSEGAKIQKTNPTAKPTETEESEEYKIDFLIRSGFCAPLFCATKVMEAW